MEKAFTELKKKLTEKPVLFVPNYEKEFVIQTDARGKGKRVVKAQQIEGEKHPIIYMSRKLTPSKQKFGDTERECAAIIFAIRKIKHYIDGQQFSIQTNHDPLC